MAWTTPKTWASGDILTAADMNAQVSNNSDFIMNTALKKFGSVTLSYASAITFNNVETTLTSMSITDPLFPSTSYVYIPWCAFWINPNTANLGDAQILIRDNGTGGTIVGLFSHRNTGTNQRFTLAGVGAPTTVASGARTVFYRGISVTATDTFLANQASTPTNQGALLAPI